MSKDSVRGTLEYLITKGEKYAAQLWPNFKAVFLADRIAFNTLRGDQQDSISEVSAEVVVKDELR